MNMLLFYMTHATPKKLQTETHVNKTGKLTNEYKKKTKHIPPKNK